MYTRPRILFWLAVILVCLGLACNPIGSITTLVSNPTNTPAPANVAVLPTLPLAPSPFPTSAERTSQVDALYVISGNPASGGTSSVQIRIRPATSPGQLRVGFLEGEVGGTGPQWHAAGWEAVLLASMLSGVDATNYEFTFSVGGRIDGPSAGGLMTVGVLAALRGDSPRPDATMTGTINPDGTIGPVGGIPHKMVGAANKGKKLVLVPIGQHFDQDMNTKQMVDVVAEGAGLGMTVREVGNVYDAYEQITGKQLPRPVVSPKSVQFPQRAFDRIKASVGTWNTRYTQERSQFNSYTKPTQTYLSASVQGADQMAAKAIGDLNQGLVGLAYFEITDAVSRIRETNVDATLLERYNAGGFNSALEYLKSVAASESELQAALTQIQLQQPKTVSDLIALFDVYSDLGAAEGQIIKSSGRIDALSANLSKETKDQILADIMGIGEDMVSASNFVQIALDASSFESGYGAAPVPLPGKIQSVADTLTRAGDANMAMFDATTVSSFAQSLNLSPDQIRANLTANDDDYRVTAYSGIGEQQLLPTMKSPLQTQAMEFGNAQNIYAYSSVLIAKYYSLGAQWDKSFKVTSFTNSKALGEMLDFADARAKELITLCGDEVPIPAIMYYENARSLRQSNANDQVLALNYYWQAVALAQADAFLTGKLTPK